MVPSRPIDYNNKEVDIHMFVNSDHSGEKLSCSSRSGFLIYMNTVIMQWFFKNQSIVETSVLGTVFIIRAFCSERVEV